MRVQRLFSILIKKEFCIGQPRTYHALVTTYHQAGIREYWLIDSREDEPELVILEWTKRGYRSVTPQVVWVKSKVLGGSFRLVINDVDEVQVEAK